MRKDGPAPLLIALHGKGGEGGEQRSRWAAVSDALGIIVVAPSKAVLLAEFVERFDRQFLPVAEVTLP